MQGRRAGALAALALLAIAVALAWGGCGNGGARGGARAGGAGASGSGGASAAGGVGGGATGGGSADAGLPYPDAEPCRWPGWYRAPMLPKGCLGACIPDDVSKRVDPLVWDDRPDWCAGCKTLETPWAGDAGVDVYRTAVSGGLEATGKPGLFAFTEFRSTTDLMGVVFDAAGHPQAAWRQDLNIGCGRTAVGFYDQHAGLDAYGTAPSKTNMGDDMFFYRSVASNVAELMTPGKATFTWPGDFIGMATVQGSWYDDDMVAEFFTHVALAYPSTGEHFYVDQLPGAPGGEWSAAQVVGDTAFVSHYDFKRTDWYTIMPDRKMRLFLGAPDRDIQALVTDGKVIIWKEGRDPVPQSNGSVIFQHYAVYESPYTTDPSKLVPHLLLAGVDHSYGDLHLANGFLEASYYVQLVPKKHTGEIVVRLSDGRAWRSILPDNMNWCLGQYPGESELWGAVTSTPVIGYGQTLARVPYSAMQVIQDSAPDGGAPEAGPAEAGAADAAGE